MEVNRICCGQRKLIEYVVVNESKYNMWWSTEVNRVCGGQRKLVEYVVANES